MKIAPFNNDDVYNVLASASSAIRRGILVDVKLRLLSTQLENIEDTRVDVVFATGKPPLRAMHLSFEDSMYPSRDAVDGWDGDLLTWGETSTCVGLVFQNSRWGVVRYHRFLVG